MRLFARSQHQKIWCREDFPAFFRFRVPNRADVPVQLSGYFFQAFALVFKNDHRHQVALAVFQVALENEVDDPLVAFLAKIMCRSRFDLPQVDLGDELGIGVIHQKVDEHENPSEHRLDERVENVAGPRFGVGFGFNLLGFHLSILSEIISFFKGENADETVDFQDVHPIAATFQPRHAPGRK